MARRKGGFCLSPGQCDAEEARRLGYDNATKVACLRGYYMKYSGVEEPEKIDWTQKESWARMWEYISQIDVNNNKIIYNIMHCSNMDATANSYSNLLKVFSHSEIQELTMYMSFLFSRVVSAYMKSDEWIAYERQAAMEGRELERYDAINHMGFQRLHSDMFNALKRDLSNPSRPYYENELLDKVDKNDLINALFWAAKDAIFKREGIKLGKHTSLIRRIAYDTATDEYSIEYNLEENVKDGWQRQHDKENGFHTLSARLREYLGRLAKIAERDEETGQLMYESTEHGLPVLNDPSDIYNAIKDIITGTRSTENMMSKLERLTRDDENLRQVYRDLEANPELADEFYAQVAGTECLYTKVFRTLDGFIGHRFMGTDYEVSEVHSYKNSISSFNIDKTIFTTNEEGKVVIDNEKYKKFRDNVIKRISKNAEHRIGIVPVSFDSAIRALEIEKGKEIGKSDFKFSREERISVEDSLKKKHISSLIAEINSNLGLGLSTTQINDLVNNPGNLESFLYSVATMFDNMDSRLNRGEAIELSRTSVSFNECINNIFERVNTSGRKNTSKRVRSDKSTRFTQIVRSKFSQEIDRIKSFAEEAKFIIEELEVSDAVSTDMLEEVADNIKKWVDDTYGRSSEYYYMSFGKKVYYNPWINELASVTAFDLKNNPEHLVYKMNYDRMLEVEAPSRGTSTIIPVEHLAKDSEIIAHLMNFQSLTRGLDGYARYPMFTTGDSLAIKYITARIFNLQSLVENFTRVARQEISRMKLEREVINAYGDTYDVDDITGMANEEAVEGKEYQSVASGTFQYLRFLNRPEYKEMLRWALERDNAEGAISSEKGLFNQILKAILIESNPDAKTLILDPSKPYDYFSLKDAYLKAVYHLYYDQNLSREENVERATKKAEKCGELGNELFKEFQSDFWDKVKDREEFSRDSYSTLFECMRNLNIYNPAVVNNAEEANGLFMYYLNTKLAKICEFQFLAAAADAYGKSVTTQKRYKMWNTPGTFANEDARYKGSDGIYHYILEHVGSTIVGNKEVGGVARKQKTVYFQDCVTSAEVTDPTFWNAVTKFFADRPDIIDLYKELDTTDGQAFLTIDSYRLLKRLTKKWDTDSEMAYNKLQKIRFKARARVAAEMGIDFNYERDGEAGWRRLKDSDKRAIIRKTVFSAEELDELQGIGSVFMSMKSHVASTEYISTDPNNPASDALLVPVEYKYSEALLVPELFPEDSHRRLLGIEMEVNDIDRACSKQCVKVGSFGEASLDFVTDEHGNHLDENNEVISETNAEGKVTKGRKVKDFLGRAQRVTANTFAEQFAKGYVHELSFGDYMYQTNTPEHISAEQLFGTQLRKHFFDSLKLYTRYNYGKVTAVTISKGLRDLSRDGGKAFAQFYNELICANIFESLEGLREFMKDRVSLSNKLCDMKMNGVSSSLTDLEKFILDDNGEFIYPLNEPTMAYDVEAIFTSIFKKSVNKQKINGGSCVQVSDYGIAGHGSDLRIHAKDIWLDKDGIEVDSETATKLENGELDTTGYEKVTNITYSDCAKAFDESYTDADGVVHSLKFSDYCDNLGYLLPSDQEITKDSEDYHEWESFTYKEVGGKWVHCEPREAETNPDVKVFKPKIEVEFPGILDVVAYRIPTERAYSVFNLKVTRFFPKLFGGQIMLPSVFIRAAGFDFDIDKLYYFKKEFKQRKVGGIKDIVVPEDWIKKQRGLAKRHGWKFDETDTENLRNSYIWDMVYTHNSEYKKALKEAKEKLLDKLSDVGDLVRQAWNLEYDYIEELVNTMCGEMGIPNDVDLEEFEKKVKEHLKSGKATEEFDNALEEYLNAGVDKISAEGMFEMVFESLPEYRILKNNEGFQKAIKDITEDNPFRFSFKLYEFWSMAKLPADAPRTAEAAFKKELHTHLAAAWIDYNYDKDAYHNNVIARNNELIKCIQSRLRDYRTMSSRFTPGGYINSEYAANCMKAIMLSDEMKGKSLSEIKEYVTELLSQGREGKKKLDALEKDLDPTNILTTCEFNERARVAQDVIGIMANQNTNAVYCQTLEELSLIDPIYFIGKDENGNIVNNIKYSILSGKGASPMGLIYLAEFLASSVDAVKIPVLNYLNINSHTASVAAMMGRLGIDPLHIGLFLNQPVIKEVCTEAAKSGDRSLDNSIRAIEEKYGLTIPGKVEYRRLTEDNLFKMLRMSDWETSMDGKEYQALILAALKEFATKAQALSNFIGKTKFTASNAVDNSLTGIVATVFNMKESEREDSKINQYLHVSFGEYKQRSIMEDKKKKDNPIMVDDNITINKMHEKEYRDRINDSPFAFEQIMFDCMYAYAKYVCSKKDGGIGVFPYLTDPFMNLYRMFSDTLTYGSLDGEMISNIVKHLPLFMLHSMKGTAFDANNPSVANGTMETGFGRNKQFYTKKFPAFLQIFLADREKLQYMDTEEEADEAWRNMQREYEAAGFYFCKDLSVEDVVYNEFLDSLKVVTITNKNNADLPNYYINIEGRKHFDQDAAPRLQSAWGALVVDPSKKVRDPQQSLAHSLFMYGLFTRGYDPGLNNFNNIVPLTVLDTLVADEYGLDEEGHEDDESATYLDFFHNLNEREEDFIGMGGFYASLIANNIGNNQLLKSFYGIPPSNVDAVNSEVVINPSSNNYPAGKIVVEDGRDYIIFTDCVNYRGESTIGRLQAKSSIESKNLTPVVRAFLAPIGKNMRLFVLCPENFVPECPELIRFDFNNPMYNLRDLKGSNLRYMDISEMISRTTDYSITDIRYITQAEESGEIEDSVDRSNATYIDVNTSQETPIRESLKVINELMRNMEANADKWRRENNICNG